MGLSRGFKAFLVASALFLWFLGTWARGPGVGTEAVAIVAASVGAAVLGVWAAGYAGILAHELGHGLAAVAVTPGRPLIEIGMAPRRLRFSLGRIDVHLGIKPGQAHCICPSPPLSAGKKLAIYAAGPIGSAVIAGFWLWVHSRAGEPVRQLALILAVIESVHAVVNLVPQEFDRPDDSGRPRTLFSDGAHIAAVLRNEPLLAPVPRTAPPIARGATSRVQTVVAAMLQIASAEGSDAASTGHLLRALATADERTREVLRTRGWKPRNEQMSAQGQVPQPTPALRRVLDAIPLGAQPEHLLLALLRSGESTALGALTAAGVDQDALRADLIASLARSS